MVRAYTNNPSNIHKIAQEAYPMVLVNNHTDWEQETHNYKAEIINALEEKYPLIFGGMDYSDCIRVTHRKDFDTMEFFFNGPFIKKVTKEFPEALI